MESEELEEEDVEADEDCIKGSLDLNRLFFEGVNQRGSVATDQQNIERHPRPFLDHSTPRKEIDSQQLSAKLHCHYGIPIQEVHRASTKSQRYTLRNDTAPIHPYARSRVYDLRQHTEASLWGPFFDDGSQDVDWEKVESIMLILHHNITLFAQSHEVADALAIPDWSKPFHGAIPYSYLSKKVDIPMEPKLPLEARDPYGITGTWMRVVCFLDYTELYDFNFSERFPPSNRARAALDTEEAIRLIKMKLVVSKVEEPGEEDGKGLPVILFKGTSSSVRPSWDPNAHSKIKGNCNAVIQKYNQC